MARSIAYNDRGRSSIEPCLVFCGPLDYQSWSRAATAELEIVSRVVSVGVLPADVLARTVPIFQGLRHEMSVQPSTISDSTRRLADLTQVLRDAWWSRIEAGAVPGQPPAGAENLWRQYWQGGGLDIPVGPHIPSLEEVTDIAGKTIQDVKRGPWSLVIGLGLVAFILWKVDR